MGKKIYVGNLPFNTTSESLSDIFTSHGEVSSSKIITDRETGRSKGFGFVEMSSHDEADSAIEKLHGSDFGGRALTVNEARPVERRDGARGPSQDRPAYMNQQNRASESSTNHWS